MLNRIVPGNYQTYDWKDEDVLETVGGGRFVVTQSEDAFGSIVTPSCSDAAYQATADYRLHTLQRTFLNCLPLNSSYRVQNGVLHQVSGDLKPAAESLLSVLTNDSRFSAFASRKFPSSVKSSINFQTSNISCSSALRRASP